MRNRLRCMLSLIVIGPVLGAAACGTVHATDRTPAAIDPSAPAPLDAALVTPAFGWVLTADRLLLTQDGGATFGDVRPPVPATTARGAFFRDAHTGYVIASTGGAIKIARTADGGRSWRVGTAGDAAAPTAEYGRLKVAFGDGDHGVILAQTSTSAMSSSATMFATQNGGASWSARSAPVAGEITVEPGGRTWLAGGVAGDRLYSSTDQGGHWSSASVAVNGPADTRAVAPPVAGVLPVTVVAGGDQTQVALLTSADGGRTWGETNRVALRGRTGPGVRVPVAVTGSGPLVLDTAGGHAYLVPAHRPAAASTFAAPDLRPAALPEGSDTVTFAPDGRSGWVLAAYGRCAKGKSDCALYHPLLATADGGATWHQLGMWQQKIN